MLRSLVVLLGFVRETAQEKMRGGIGWIVAADFLKQLLRFSISVEANVDIRKTLAEAGDVWKALQQFQVKGLCFFRLAMQEIKVRDSLRHQRVLGFLRGSGIKQP